MGLLCRLLKISTSIDEFVERCNGHSVREINCNLYLYHVEPFWLLFLPEVHVGWDELAEIYIGRSIDGTKVRFIQKYRLGTFPHSSSIAKIYTKLIGNIEQLKVVKEISLIGFNQENRQIFYDIAEQYGIEQLVETTLS